MRCRRNPLAFWLAALAAVLNLLWPLLAQAQASVLVPVCTVEGVTHYIELDTGKNSLPGHGEHKHCPACAVTAQPAMANAELSFVPQPDEGHAHVAQDVLPRAAFQYPPRQSRAPPRLSSV